MSYENYNTKTQPKAKSQSQKPKPKAKAKSQKPKARSQKPEARAKSQKPKAKSQKPKAKAKSQKPKARSQNPEARAKSQKPKAQSQKPKAQSQKPKAKSQKPNANQRFWLQNATKSMQIRDVGSKMQQIARKTAPDWKTQDKSLKNIYPPFFPPLPPEKCKLHFPNVHIIHGCLGPCAITLLWDSPGCSTRDLQPMTVACKDWSTDSVPRKSLAVPSGNIRVKPVKRRRCYFKCCTNSSPWSVLPEPSPQHGPRSPSCALHVASNWRNRSAEYTRSGPLCLSQNSGLIYWWRNRNRKSCNTSQWMSRSHCKTCKVFLAEGNGKDNHFEGVAKLGTSISFCSKHDSTRTLLHHQEHQIWIILGI